MKKVLFIQNNASTFGGIWSINSILAKKFQSLGFEVVISAIRNEFDSKEVQDINTYVVNPKDNWNVLSLKSCAKLLLKFKIKEFFSSYYNNKKRYYDILKLRHFINDYKPDYIIASHYQVLDGIPKEYYKKAYLHVHSNFNEALNHPATKKQLFRYKDKIGFIWLSKKTMDEAIKLGLKKSIYIYNFVKFESTKNADVIKSKKMVAITRLAKEKNIDLMIKMVEDVFKDNKCLDWKLEIYGEGSELAYLKSLIHSKQITIMSKTDDVKSVLLSSSINLNTSFNEGFCLSIIEGYECGVPSISFDFKDPTNEVVLNNKTGYIAKDKEDFIKKIKELIDNPEKRNNMAINAKKHSQQFHLNKIIDDWLDLFKKIDEGEKND